MQKFYSPQAIFYILTRGQQTNGAISITYIPKDNTPGTECFFGTGSTQAIRELIAKINAAEADDTIQADLTASANLSGTVLDAARKKQVHLDLAVGNGVHWEIDGHMVPAGATDTELGVVRTNKKNGNISEEAITEIAGKYNSEQLNVSDNFLLLPSGADLRIETDSSLASWKCVIIQHGNNENKLAGNQLLKNGEAYIRNVQEKNYLLIYGKNGDVTCDEKSIWLT